MSKKEVLDAHMSCFTLDFMSYLSNQEARLELQRAIDLPGTYPADRRAQDAARTLMAQHFK
jgi:hypothetical protein